MLYKNDIQILIEKVKQQSLRIFLAKDGDYGLITNKAGSQVLTFGIDKMLGHFYFNSRHKKSGAYGTGFRVAEVVDINKVNPRDLMAIAARKDECADIPITTLSEHLDEYKCCEYVEQH